MTKYLLSGLLALLAATASAERPATEPGQVSAGSYRTLVENEAYEQALPLVKKAAEAGDPDALIAIPVYLLRPRAAENLKGSSKDARQGTVDNDLDVMALMVEHVHLSPKQSKVSLELEQDRITLSHDPESGHSSWRFPDFAPVDEHEEQELWREVRLEFSLPPGKTFADYEIPISFQTNLAPANVVNLFVYKSGRISLQTATARGEYEYQFHSDDELDPNVVNLLELFTSSQGNWLLRVNRNVKARGAFDPRYFQNGLSNRAYFEGRIQIHSLALRELVPGKTARSNPEYSVGEISRIERKSASGYLERYLAELFPHRADDQRWRFAGTELLYLRRDIEFMEMPDQRIVRRPMYLTESMVMAQPKEGDPIIFPVQKAMAVGTNGDWAKGKVNKRKTTFSVHLYSRGRSNIHEYSGRISRAGKGWK